MPSAAKRLLALRFRPAEEGDGVLEREGGASIPVPAPDWDRALELLRKINLFVDSSGRRLSSRITVDGFEPWWYSQDRLLRFYLVPLTQYFPLLEVAEEYDEVRIELAPGDLRRFASAYGKPFFFSEPPERSSIGAHALMDASIFSLAAFRIARRDTVVYCVDNVGPGLREDFRFSPLYRELERRKYRFAEYVHTLSPRQALRNMWIRRRPAFFLEGADELARQLKMIRPVSFDLPPESESREERALRRLIPTVLAWAAQSAARQAVLKSALSFQKAERAIAFDDNRHNHELIAACKTLKIPVLGFQHGVFNEFHAGLMAFEFAGSRSHGFDRYGVWSGVFRERLRKFSKLYRGEEIFVCGPVRPPEGSQANKPNREASKTIRVLVVSEALSRKKEVIPYLRALQSDPRFTICLKLRPGESERSVEEYGLSPKEATLLRTSTVYEAFREVDVAIGTYSTVLYEAALTLLPIVWMKTSRAYGRELATEGLADAAMEPGALPGVIAQAVSITEAERIARRNRIWGENPGDGAKQLLDEAERSLWPTDRKKEKERL